MTCAEAARLTGLAATTIRDWIAEGKVKGVGIKIDRRNGKDRHIWFPTLEAVQTLQDALRQANDVSGELNPTPSTAPVLVHPNDQVCLEARRELWRRNNRKFQEI